MVVKTKETIGTFKAITFTGEAIDFVVKGDGIYCDFLSERLSEENRAMPIRMLQLKPNFTYYYTDNYSWKVPCYLKETGMKNSLIKNFEINEDLLTVMTQLELVRYSHDMAVLYGLNAKYSYDRKSQTRAFKHVPKEKRMVLAKRGIFN